MPSLEIGPVVLEKKSKIGSLQTVGQTDGQTDGRTDRQTPDER